MGLNTGVQDAHNLAWKLNAVMHASADDSLLDTYETERRVIAQRNTDASLENAFKMFDVFAALPTGDLEAISAAIANQATHFDMLGLQMGFRYVLNESVAPLEPLSEAVIRTYTPSSQPGGRLPHGWLQRNGVTISSLDLVPLDSHVVIAGSDAETTSELAVLRLGTDFTDPNDWWGMELGLSPTATLVVRPDQHIAERNT
jgi:2,4-dichlorophenol 6-monooxygenase